MGYLVGWTRDPEGSPIRAAVVYSEEDGATAVSDHHGRFVIGPLLARPTAILWVEAVGYARFRWGDEQNVECAVVGACESDIGSITLWPESRVVGSIDVSGVAPERIKVVVVPIQYQLAMSVRRFGRPIVACMKSDLSFVVAGIPAGLTQVEVFVDNMVRWSDNQWMQSGATWELHIDLRGGDQSINIGSVGGGCGARRLSRQDGGVRKGRLEAQLHGPGMISWWHAYEEFPPYSCAIYEGVPVTQGGAPATWADVDQNGVFDWPIQVDQSLETWICLHRPGWPATWLAENPGQPYTLAELRCGELIVRMRSQVGSGAAGARVVVWDRGVVRMVRYGCNGPAVFKGLPEGDYYVQASDGIFVPGSHGRFSGQVPPGSVVAHVAGGEKNEVEIIMVPRR